MNVLQDSQQKLSQLSANFSSLQLEYDNAQDTIEVLKKEVAELTKALKQRYEWISSPYMAIYFATYVYKNVKF